jgi:hypothetical protein
MPKMTKKEERIIEAEAAKGALISEIADKLDRHDITVRTYLEKSGVPYKEMTTDQRDRHVLKNRLTQRAYWQEVEQQFSTHEINQFMEHWINLMRQFREDVLYNEELQIKQLVTLQILMDRSMKDRKAQVEELERLQKSIDEEYAINRAERDDARIAHMESQIAFVRNTVASYTKEHVDLLRQLKDIEKALKATREQRIKRIEDSKTSFMGWLRSLEDEDVRARTGDDIELIRLAKDKAREKLSEYHEFGDGRVDVPFLNADTVGRLDD